MIASSLKAEKRTGRWPVWAVGGVALLGASVFVVRATRPALPVVASTSAGGGSSAADPGAPGDRPRDQRGSSSRLSPSAPLAESGADRVLQAWRGAVLEKRAPQVLACETSFLADPGLYHRGLVTLAAGDPEERVRSFATFVLGEFAMAGDVDFFGRLLQNDSSAYVRQNAARALGRLGQRRSVELLRCASQDDPDKDVRAAASGALALIR